MMDLNTVIERLELAHRILDNDRRNWGGKRGYSMLKATEGCAAALSHLKAMQWVSVARFVPEFGICEIRDAEYPPFDVPVIVKSESATGIKYDIHTLRSGQGNFSWPSFGVAWRYAEPGDQT